VRHHSIPIIFAAVPDPVALGLVKSLAHPGTNLTGLATWVVDPAKPIQLLKEINPALKRLLVIIGPMDTMQPGALAKIREAARNSAIQTFEKSAITPDQVAEGFASVPLEADDGVIAASQTNNQIATIAKQALRHKLAFAANRREALEAGALFSYGTDVAASGADVAVYVDEVLKGAAPASLPVAEPTSFKFVISVKTAKAIGVRIPDAVLARAYPGREQAPFARRRRGPEIGRAIGEIDVVVAGDELLLHDAPPFTTTNPMTTG
jgi:putative tryptophan/tyrosine transport system substrate-binding protein